MFKKRSYTILLILAACLVSWASVYSLLGHVDQAGPLFILFFLLLAVGVRGNRATKGFSYTVIIFAAVTTALYYPNYFLEINGFVLAALITPLIQLIMFGMGTSMSMNDFAAVAKMPKGVVVGLACQFTIMPVLGYTLARLTDFPPEIAAGIILIGCSPSGMASNVICYLAKGNLALSITVTSLATLFAPFLTPLLMGWLGGSFIAVDVLAMMWDIFKMVIIPIGLGLAVNRIFRDHSNIINQVMPLVSMAGIAVIIVIITAAGRGSLLSIGPLLILVVLMHNVFGYTLGYWTARLFNLNEKDCRTIAIEVGMQNGGLASGIAKEMGKIATVGLAPAVFGPLMNITGSILASWWRSKPIAGQDAAGPAVMESATIVETRN